MPRLPPVPLRSMVDSSQAGECKACRADQRSSNGHPLFLMSVARPQCGWSRGSRTWWFLCPSLDLGANRGEAVGKEGFIAQSLKKNVEPRCTCQNPQVVQGVHSDLWKKVYMLCTDYLGQVRSTYHVVRVHSAGSAVMCIRNTMWVGSVPVGGLG